MAKKVGQQTATDKGKKEKKEKKGRVAFDIANAKVQNDDGELISAANADGLLTAVPVTVLEGETVVYEGFDLRKHKPLKKGNFADIATFLMYQAFVIRQRAAKMVALAVDKEGKAARIRKFGDEATRKKAMKIEKMRAMLAAYEKELEAEGINIDEI